MWGWRSVYYVHSAAGPILFGLWIWLYTDFPENHRMVNEKEKEIIMNGKDTDKRKFDGFVPYMVIMFKFIFLLLF